jgi:phenylacetate-CoA ligase
VTPHTAAGATSRERLEADQLAKLRRLLAELIPANRFYSAKLQAARVGPETASVAAFLERTPFTVKQELAEDQSKNPPFGSNLTYPLERYTRLHQTSATTGSPMRWLDTPESWDWMLDNWIAVYAASGVTPRDRFFCAFSFGPFLGFWTAFEAAEKMGCLCIPGGGLRTVQRVRAILDLEATALCCTPTYAIRLAEAAAAEGIPLDGSQVRRIVVGGEPGGCVHGTRALIEDLWPGARVFDHHGMTEIGPVSYECPARRGVLHVIESAFIAEVVDPISLEPVEPGAEGELVLTNLGRTGSPLLRYRTGDLVRRGRAERCACGTYDLPLEGGILARTDDMEVIRGVNVYPSAVEDVVRSCGGVAEYRVRIRTVSAMPEMSIDIEPVLDHPDPAGLGRQIGAALSRTFALRIPVSCVPTGSLPRFDMKARRWLRE